MTALSALRARHRMQYRVVDAGKLAALQAWKDEQWKPVRELLPHDVADRHIETLRTGGNDVVDGRVNK